MTARERIVKADSIQRRQQAGKISAAQATAEFDLLLDDCGDLHYFGDTTLMRAEWDGQMVMVFPKGAEPGNNRLENYSNTGIITQGPRRGEIVTHPIGQTCACNSSVLAHFQELSRLA